MSYQPLKDASNTKENGSIIGGNGVIVAKLRYRMPSPCIHVFTQSKVLTSSCTLGTTYLLPTGASTSPPPQWTVIEKGKDIGVVYSKCKNSNCFVYPTYSDGIISPALLESAWASTPFPFIVPIYICPMMIERYWDTPPGRWWRDKRVP